MGQLIVSRFTSLFRIITGTVSLLPFLSSSPAAVIKESRRPQQTANENILRMQRLLDNYTSVIEVHIEDIRSLTNAIRDFREVWQEHNERVTALGHALDHFTGTLEETPTNKTESNPGMETLQVPPGCYRNRSSALLRK